MKKIKKLLTIGLAFFIVLVVSFGLVGCKEKEDCIPETLGEAEGLYLYYDNYRSFTDGTQTERLLNDITVGGERYSVEEYEIEKLAYMTSEKEIFYSLKTNKEGEESRYFLWHYNYDTKENDCMRILDGGALLQTSDTYLFVRVYNDRSYFQAGYLYDGDLNCVEEKTGNYYLSGDMLYSYNDYGFFWWKNGRFFSVEVNGGRLNRNFLWREKYLYLFLESKVYFVDLDTGENQIVNLPQGEKYFDAFEDYGGSVVKNGGVYFITYKTEIETQYVRLPLQAGCSLWVLNGMDMQKVYEFPEKYAVDFNSPSSNENYINFELEYVPKWFNSEKKTKRTVAYYNLEANTLTIGSQKVTELPKSTFVVGEYQFYISSVHYGPMMGGNYCYYLHRITDGKDEILQYYFDENAEPNPILFEDICVK